jgi:hypothetical protein
MLLGSEIGSLNNGLRRKIAAHGIDCDLHPVSIHPNPKLSLFLFNDNHFLALVGTTASTDVMGQNRLMALRAKRKGRGLDLLVSPPFVSS